MDEAIRLPAHGGEPARRCKVIPSVKIAHAVPTAFLGMMTIIGLAGCGSAPVVPAGLEATSAKSPAAQTVTILVTSEPAYGMVVVNRVPVGVAPQRIKLPATAAGFFREPVTIAVRFVSREVDEASISEAQDFNTLDRVPVRLEFQRYKPPQRIYAE